jgi:hypothetical protein
MTTAMMPAEYQEDNPQRRSHVESQDEDQWREQLQV